jgi:hypothetical protein
LIDQLSFESIADFISVSWKSREFHEKMNCEIWFRHCNRLILPVSHLRKSSRLTGGLVGGRMFEFESNSRHSGIICSLTSECGSNVHDCGIVVITDSSHYLDDYTGKFAADHGNSLSCFNSPNNPG